MERALVAQQRQALQRPHRLVAVADQVDRAGLDVSVTGDDAVRLAGKLVRMVAPHAC